MKKYVANLIQAYNRANNGASMNNRRSLLKAMCNTSETRRYMSFLHGIDNHRPMIPVT